MRRSLTLIRHAKSSWNNPGCRDFDRPLNRRGKSDAPKVAQYLIDKSWRINRTLCSPAQRAHETLQLMTTHGLSAGQIIYVDELYGAGQSELLDLIVQIDKAYSDIAIIAHNPGLEDLANWLSMDRVGQLATCCTVRFDCNMDNWQSIGPSAVTNLEQVSPKTL